MLLIFSCLIVVMSFSIVPLRSGYHRLESSSAVFFYCQATGNSYVSIRAVCRSLVFIELYYILVSGISISFVLLCSGSCFHNISI